MIKLRKKQILPKSKRNIWLLLAGRGFGKTLAGANIVAEFIQKKYIKHIALIADNLYEARRIMVEGNSGILNQLEKLNIKYKYTPSLRIIKANESTIYFFSGDNYNSLRGFEFDFVWIDELTKYRYPTELFDQVIFCLRLTTNIYYKIVITTTPRPIELLNNLLARTDVHVTRGTSYENKYLSKQYFKNIKLYENTSLGKQEIYGEIINKSLWEKNDIIYKIPLSIYRYILGVDPAIKSGYTGIILIGIDYNENIFVIDDFSANLSVDNWVNIINKLYIQYNCTVAIETNQGGSMIKKLLQDINIIECHSIKSKINRAFDAYILYKLQKVFHVKELKQLEYEMLYSPKDRVDALVWAITIYKNITIKPFYIDYI